MLDALPTGRTPAAILNTIPGTSPGFFATNFRGTSDSVTMVDGMRASNLIGAGPSLTTAPTSSSMYQEYSFSTNIDSAEVGQSGDPHQPDSQGRRQPAARHDLQHLHAGRLAVEQHRRLPAVAGTHRAAEDDQAVGLQPERRRTNRPRSSVVPDDLSEQRQRYAGRSAASTMPTRRRTPIVPTRHAPPSTSIAAYSFVQRLTWQGSQKDKVAGHYERQDSKTPYFGSPLLGHQPAARVDAGTRRSEQRSGRRPLDPDAYVAPAVRNLVSVEPARHRQQLPRCARAVVGAVPRGPRRAEPDRHDVGATCAGDSRDRDAAS